MTGPTAADRCFDEKMQAMSRLAGGMAHQFNNLLAAILATTDLALESASLEPSVRADLQHIRESARRASAITRQLIAFSGSQTIAPRLTRVNDVIAGLEPMLAHVVPPGITLSLDLRGEETVALDPLRLEQMLLTLVVNASDALGEHGNIRVATADAMADGAPCTDVIVSDDGPGMDDAMRARLFEPFFTSKGEAAAGTSLGLAAVFGTMRQHGGTVMVESEPGRGARVVLRFPRQAHAADAITHAASGDQARAEVILVVEDEPLVRAPICRTLRALGYFVLEANNGEHALVVMQEHHAPVHLVITDVRMPEMDGAELVRLLRDWYPRMRVLFISGYSHQYVESRAGTVDGGAFLAKPFTMDALRARVRELLEPEWSGG